MKGAVLVLLVLISVVGADGNAFAADADRVADGQEHDARETLLEATLPELVAALASGETSSLSLVNGFLDRIDEIDWAGPRLQSVLAVNPRARQLARESDARREAGEARGRLDGIPVLLKDNIESNDPMPTTAGSFALIDNLTGRDSPLVAGLRAQGAIILGKTNLSQWANFRSRDSISGWSSIGGQVRNPHMLDRSPCGSSSGSGAAVAASLAAGAVGTETNGSIICPSTVNGIVGFKPTVGLVSQRYIVPISSSQDTAGPMTKTVAGAAMMLTAMASGEEKIDFADSLKGASFDGQRIGVARFAEGSNLEVIARFDQALDQLAAAGAELVEITEHEPPENFFPSARIVLQVEFKATLDEYLADAADGVEPRSLEALIAFNEQNGDRELSLFGQDIFEASVERSGLDSKEYLDARALVQRATREDGIDLLLSTNDLVAIVSPSGPLAPRVDPINGDVWPPWAGAGWMAAVAGYPHLTVPMGTVDGLPIGLSLIGAHGADAEILRLGFAYELLSQQRVSPQFLASAEDRAEIDRAMNPAREGD